MRERISRIKKVVLLLIALVGIFVAIPIIRVNAQSSDNFTTELSPNYPDTIGDDFGRTDIRVQVARIIRVSMSVLTLLSMVGIGLGIYYLNKSKRRGNFKKNNLNEDEIRSRSAKSRKGGLGLLVSSISVLVLMLLAYMFSAFTMPNIVPATTTANTGTAL